MIIFCVANSNYRRPNLCMYLNSYYFQILPSTSYDQLLQGDITSGFLNHRMLSLFCQLAMSNVMPTTECLNPSHGCVLLSQIIWMMSKISISFGSVQSSWWTTIVQLCTLREKMVLTLLYFNFTNKQWEPNVLFVVLTNRILCFRSRVDVISLLIKFCMSLLHKFMSGWP